MAEAVCTPSMADFRAAVSADLQVHTGRFLTELSGMFAKLTHEARLTTRSLGDMVVDLEEDKTPPETPKQMPEGATYLDVCKSELESWCTLMMDSITQEFRDAVRQAHKTALVELEPNDHKDQNKLLHRGKVLSGREGLKRIENEGLLVSDFLKEKMMDQTQVNKVKPEFSKELKRRKMKICDDKPQEELCLKRQNNLLGIAYMQTDKRLMEEVLEHVQQLRYERAQTKRDRIKVKKEHLKVKQELD